MPVRTAHGLLAARPARDTRVEDVVCTLLALRFKGTKRENRKDRIGEEVGLSAFHSPYDHCSMIPLFHEEIL